jgi:hypothetical protein
MLSSIILRSVAVHFLQSIAADACSTVPNPENITFLLIHIYYESY